MYRLILSRKTEKFLVNLQKVNVKLFKKFIIALDEISQDPYCAKAL
jgi:mRNA-degrading endonuclease RelE of RelBE toxin-antitoxin system